MSWVLVAAGVYNLVWGAWTVLFPASYWGLIGASMPSEALPLWQCIGMIVGVYGLGYLIASRDPMTHWPIVLVGLLGKVFGPMGYAFSVAQGAMPVTGAWVILFNDLIWWGPFAVILWKAWSSAMAPKAEVPTPITAEAFEASIKQATTSDGQSLWALSHERPVMVVFLRHLGCTFCREALAELSVRRASIEASTRIVLVHMSPADEGRAFFDKMGLPGVVHISDPTQRLYQHFSLSRGTFWQLFGPRVVWRGMMAFVRGAGIGKLAGDGMQMPGAFVLDRGRISREHRYAHAGDRPDYVDLSMCPLPAKGATRAA
jgi:AhpC/TSA antioxidant enzyme